MAVLLRQFSSTFVVLATSLIWGVSSPLVVSACAAAALIDLLLVGKSAELGLYRSEPSSPGRELSTGQALSLHVFGAIAASATALMARLLDVNATVQGLVNLGALVIAGSAASYAGFRAVRRTGMSISEQVDRLESLPDILFLVNLLPRHASRVLGSFVRLMLGVMAMAPYVALLHALPTTHLNVSLAIIVVGLALFFQLGFILISQSLFSLRWRRTRPRPESESRGI